MARAKAYTVWIGRTPGVFLSWAECEASVKGFRGAKFKSFGSTEAAEKAFIEPWENHITIHKLEAETAPEPIAQHEQAQEPVLDTVVDDDEAPF